MRKIIASALAGFLLLGSFTGVDAYAKGENEESSTQVASVSDAVEEEDVEPLIGATPEEEEEILIPIEEHESEEYEVRTEDRIHYIKLNGNGTQSSDAILIESNGHFGLIDASNKYPDTQYGIPIDRSASGAAVLDYLCSVGVTHLDFILATHAHSDHIGGIPEIAKYLLETDISEVPEHEPIEVEVEVEGGDGELSEDPSGDPEPEYYHGELPLVDENTTYIYKSFTKNASEEEWENEKYFDDAEKAMGEASKLIVNNPSADALKFISATKEENGEGDKDDTISFTFGDLNISLYNLYSRSNTDENANSILTYIEKNNIKTLLLADIDVYDNLEQDLAKAVVAQHGKINVMKVGHHGFERSTSKELVDTLGANYAIVQTTNAFLGTYSPFYAYMNSKGRNVFRTYDQPGIAIIQDMTKSFDIYNATAIDIDPVEAYKKIKETTYQIEGDDTRYLVVTETTVVLRSKSVVGSEKATKWVQNDGLNNWSKWYYTWDEYDWVFVNADGTLKTGWADINKASFFFNSDGIMQTGWVKKNGKDVYLLPEDYGNFKMGSMITGWYQMDKVWWYFAPDGSKFTGWLNNKGTWYYIEDGKMFFGGFKKLGEDWFYFDKDGKMQEGWTKIDGSLYCFGEDGKAHKGWMLSNDKWYFCDEKGKCATGSYSCNGKTYIFDDSGVLSASKGWVKSGKNWYYSNEDGTAYSGWVSSGDYWYYIKSNGQLVTEDWVNSSGWYYMNADGVMMTGWAEVRDDWYYLGTNGLMQTGWVSSTSGWYFMLPSGAMATGWVSDGGDWYYMGEGGTMQTGWVKSGNIWYYMNSSGAMVTGTRKIDGKSYTFDGNGALL